MAKSVALGFLTFAAVSFLAVFLLPVPDEIVKWAFPATVMAFPVAIVAVAVSRVGRVGRIGPPLAALLALLEFGVIGVAAFAGSAVDGPGGLPVSLWLLLLMVWLGPLFLTTLSYAATFEALGIDTPLLERLEELRLANERSRTDFES